MRLLRAACTFTLEEEDEEEETMPYRVLKSLRLLLPTVCLVLSFSLGGVLCSYIYSVGTLGVASNSRVSACRGWYVRCRRRR
jgi:hypothetical protein